MTIAPKLINTAGLLAGVPKADLQSCAGSVYRMRSANATELLRRLTAALEGHGARAAAKPGDWGLPGDLARVEGALAEALAVLGDESGVRELGME